MDETKQADDRWRELADLLGIPEEKPGAKGEPAALAPRPVAPVELTPPPPRPEPKIQEPEPPPVRLEAEAPPLEPVQEWEAASEEDDTDIEETHIHGEAAPAAAEHPAEPGAPLGEDGEPRRGRRRRRRGRRRGGDRPEGEPHDAAAPKEQEPRADPAGPREHQGRGRGRDRDDDRRRPAPPRDEQEQPEPADHEEPRAQPVAQDDALLAEDTDFSNWNVPSWQDLIASLYRPDR